MSVSIDGTMISVRGPCQLHVADFSTLHQIKSERTSLQQLYQKAVEDTGYSGVLEPTSVAGVLRLLTPSSDLLTIQLYLAQANHCCVAVR